MHLCFLFQSLRICAGNSFFFFCLFSAVQRLDRLLLHPNACRHKIRKNRASKKSLVCRGSRIICNGMTHPRCLVTHAAANCRRRLLHFARVGSCCHYKRRHMPTLVASLTQGCQMAIYKKKMCKIVKCQKNNCKMSKKYKKFVNF
jgi:hypothetical protein